MTILGSLMPSRISAAGVCRSMPSKIAAACLTGIATLPEKMPAQKSAASDRLTMATNSGTFTRFKIFLRVSFR
jgi:hypothetical protein